MASDPAMNTQNTVLSSKAQSATSATTTHAMAAICRCRLPQHTAQARYRYQGELGGVHVWGRRVVERGRRDQPQESESK